jgi:hypothetical protein
MVDSPGQLSEVQKPKKPASPLVIMVIALIFIMWLMLLFLDKGIYDSYGMDLSREVWVYLGSVIMIILICVLLVSGFPSKSRQPAPVSAQSQFTAISSPGPVASIQPAVIPTPVAAPEGVVITSAQPLEPVEVAAEIAVVEAEPIVVEAEIVEAEPVEEEVEESDSVLKTKKPRLIEYPKKVPGGVYGDTIVRVDPRTKLNLRTLLIRSCMICDRQGKCWEEIMDTIPRDEFLWNIECKRGLRKHKDAGTETKKKMKRKKMIKSKPTDDSEIQEDES